MSEFEARAICQHLRERHDPMKSATTSEERGVNRVYYAIAVGVAELDQAAAKKPRKGK